MGAADRTVQRLHLRAPSAQAAVHAVHRLEDALRCASLPDTGERLLLVRRLHLGRLPEGLSSQSLSLLIEQRVAAVGGEWVHGDEERAARSDTVFFANRLQAAQAALRWRSQGGELNAWYWPLALPGVAVRAAPAGFLTQLVECLGAQPEAPALLPVLAIDALEHGHARWLMRHVDAALAHRWVALAGAQRFLPATVSWAGGGSDVPSSGDAGNPVEPLETRETPDGPPWLSALLRADAGWGGGATAVAAPGLGPIAVSWSSLTRAPALASPSARSGRANTRASVTPAVPAAQVVDGRWPDADGAQGVINEVVPHSPGIDGGAATQAGGLWFLLPLLERLGFADWQALHAEQAVLALILRQALRCLRVPHDDPAWAWVDSLPCVTDLAPRRWNLPGCWATPAVHLRHHPRAALTAQAMARWWLIAVRRRLRHDANLSLADLCRRPARLRWSRTHVDVAFARNAADVRVRRLGLDIDPGWVPWLGRVVVFVYGSPEGEDT